jgi:hypothetical protein
MKTTICSILLFITLIGASEALDTQSYEFIEYLLSRTAPGAPETFEDAIVFTAPSHYKRVGIAFAGENFERIHWFKKLLVPIDDAEPIDPQQKIPPAMLRDSGILFYAHTINPQEHNNERLAYRLVVDGLWTSDPQNPRKKLDPHTGLEFSLVSAPPQSAVAPDTTPSNDRLALHYQSAPGETITVAGDFNNWDPFMYPLREDSPGSYSLTLPLPAGTWRYILFQRGRRILDASNLNKVYTPDGAAVNVAVIQ